MESLKRELAVLTKIFGYRGYVTEDGEIITKIDSNEAVFCAPSGRRVYMFVVTRVAEAAAYYALSRDPDTETVVIVVDKSGASQPSIFEKERQSGGRLEIWTRHALAFDKFASNFQPKDVRENDEDLRGVNPRTLPHMMPNDVLVRYFRFSPESVIVAVSPIDNSTSMFYVRKH